ncbi:MAG: hypothetical protein ACKPKO_60395, partial [Candidatus Fonsibacter sp.]
RLGKVESHHDLLGIGYGDVPVVPVYLYVVSDLILVGSWSTIEISCLKGFSKLSSTWHTSVYIYTTRYLCLYHVVFGFNKNTKK